MAPEGSEGVELRLGAAQWHGRTLELSSQEVAVLGVLLDAGGRVVGRSELQRRAGLSHVAPRRCDALIVGLRRALGAGTIVTVRGRGWRCSASLACSHAPSPVPA